MGGRARARQSGALATELASLEARLGDLTLIRDDVDRSARRVATAVRLCCAYVLRVILLWVHSCTSISFDVF
jgi:hypothetical protein